jgi:hypothetical protein
MKCLRSRLFFFFFFSQNMHFILFYFIFDMSIQEERWGIQTSDLLFMRRDSQPIELYLGNMHLIHLI